MPTVFQKLLPDGIGYIAVGVFGEPTAEEFGAALKHLQRQNARAYVIDLRNNGGGYVNAAVAIADHFIHSGPIVSVAERSGTTRFSADANADETHPVAVLVNHYSASASEITAGALQDAGVATLVGSRTYGKGVVQQLTYNADGSAMKVTTARYLTPRNRLIDGIGLAPDVNGRRERARALRRPGRRRAARRRDQRRAIQSAPVGAGFSRLSSCSSPASRRPARRSCRLRRSACPLLAMVCTSRSTRSMLVAPPASARAADEGGSATAPRWRIFRTARDRLGRAQRLAQRRRPSRTPRATPRCRRARRP